MVTSCDKNRFEEKHATEVWAPKFTFFSQGKQLSAQVITIHRAITDTSFSTKSKLWIRHSFCVSQYWSNELVDLIQVIDPFEVCKTKSNESDEIRRKRERMKCIKLIYFKPAKENRTFLGMLTEDGRNIFRIYHQQKFYPVRGKESAKPNVEQKTLRVKKEL